MACYINSIASSDALTNDFKELVTAPDVRRRMSRAVKMGVSAGMEAIGGLPVGEKISAIITATGLGCLADSEKFLRNVIDNGETLLNPTPFIQSTFNTVGGQIAQLTGNNGYNMTYVHGGLSFESALLDAAMQIEECGVRNVLVGSFDESTPSQRRIMERMGMWRGASCGEGAYAFVLSGGPLNGGPVRLASLEFPDEAMSREQVAGYADAENVLWNDFADGVFHTVSARSLYRAVGMVRGGVRRVAVYNGHSRREQALMVVECIG